MNLSEEQILSLYKWLDNIPLSRRKRNITRDFSDGVLMAEVVHRFFPSIIDLHNYSQGLRVDTKLYNWKHLNEKVLKKIGFELDFKTINDLANSKKGVIEIVLYNFREIALDSRKDDAPYFQNEIISEINKLSSSKLENPPFDLLEEKINECSEQASYIEALESKIQKLEELLKLKDNKIEQLRRQLRIEKVYV